VTATSLHTENTLPADETEKERFWRTMNAVGRELWAQNSTQQLSRQAAAVAYSFVFSFVPLVVFIFSAAATISRRVAGTETTIQRIMDWVFDNLPTSTAQAVEQPLQDAITASSGGLISVSAIVALFGARGAIGSLIDGLNASYGVREGRPFLRKQLVALGLTIAVGLGIILAVVLLILGEQIGAFLAGPLGLGDFWATVWNYGRWPLILILLVFALAALYWAGPNVRLPFRWLSPGALLAVPSWIIVTLGLNLYFQYFGSYAASYGVLGGVMAFIFYIYVMSYILLIGGALNAILAKRSRAPIVPKANDIAEGEKPSGESALIPTAPGPTPGGRITPPAAKERAKIAVRTLALAALATVLGIIGARRD
jgi:membrane protein